MDKLNLQDKKVAILGVGIEGIALANFLSDKVEQLVFLDCASKEDILDRLKGEEKEGAASLLNKFELISGEKYLDNCSSYDVIFRSPGISYFNPKIQEAIEHGIKVSSQIKLFFDLCPCKIIGVTGTKGKGTTASLIYEILKNKFQNQNYKLQIKTQISNSKNQNSYQLPTTDYSTNIYLAGNIGYPAITLIPKLKNDDIVILELSSFQLMDLDKSPYIATITNLTVDHLDYHRDINEYREAKFNILKYQNENDLAILNKESTFALKNLQELKSKIEYFSNENDQDYHKSENGNVGAIVKDGAVILDPENRNIEICNLENINLLGSHNLENIAAATLAACALKVDSVIISEAVKSFKGLPYRVERVAEINGVLFVNDSFATNPDPTMAAINSFPQNKILILGGSSKGADFDDLADKISKSEVSGVVLIGVEGEKIKVSLFKKEFKGKIIEAKKTMDEIVAAAMSLAKMGDVVIFSPACASFDMFKNYKDRGEKFKTAVMNLKSETRSSKSEINQK